MCGSFKFRLIFKRRSLKRWGIGKEAKLVDKNVTVTIT